MIGWWRIGGAGLLGAAALVAMGDSGKAQVTPGGIDPLEVLSLQVRANAIIVLDSSGSMREMPDVDPNDTTSPVGGEVAGDDPTSKLLQAKTVLQQVIAANETKVSFQFGRYIQDPNSYGPEAARRFLYTRSCAATDNVCNTAARNIVINNSAGASCDDADCNSGLYRLNNGNFERTTNGVTTHHMYANRFFNGEYVQARQSGATLVAGGIVSDAGDFGPTTLPPNGPGPWVEVQNLANSGSGTIGSRVRFQFQGIRWAKGNNTSTSCGGFENLVGLAPCTVNTQIGSIGPHLSPELELTATGNIVGYTNQAVGGNPGAAQRPPQRGIRASGLTPLAESLIDLKSPVFQGIWTGIAALPPTSPKPRTFAIIVTDGDDSCPNATTADTSTGANADARALRAAYRAQLLYQRIVATEPASSVTTFVVSFGSGASSVRSDWIAWAGSGMNQNGSFCGGAGQPACIPLTTTGYAATRWSRAPTAQERADCTTCRDAFVAADADELIAALQAAIEQGQSQGEFSDQQSITDSIFELTQTVAPVGGPTPPPSPNPSDPETRYSTRVPVLLQSTFEMPGFNGHLKAFRNNAGATLPLWDAGEKLRQRVAGVPPVGVPPTVLTRTFEQLCGASGANPAPGSACFNIRTGDIRTASANTIKRRIYTTTQNGYFLSDPGGDDAIVRKLIGDSTPSPYMPPLQIPLWPPDPSILAGTLDHGLGLTLGTMTQVDKLAQLKTIGACTPTSNAAPTPLACRTGQPLATQLAAAVQEARRIILAHAAGAGLLKSGNNASRMGVTAACPAGGCLQFNPLGWVMAESTLAASAISTPPIQKEPSIHNAEYKLFRDGPRNALDRARPGVSKGFGLRNPDLDADPPANISDPQLKPVMSVIYHGTNHMVHAFRGGFQSASPTGVCTQSATNECGGEELWAFVPFDQLSKLIERIKPQVRNPHTYVVAAPIRVTDIFVPGTLNTNAGGVTLSGAGVWRTVILFGRGVGGKYLTALDVTAPGTFNQHSLETAPPIAMWSRGNPDTTLGTTTIGTPAGNAYNNPLTTADFTAYTGMGQTWSVPAITFVTAAQNTTNRRGQGVEFVAYTGSGYGLATEGTTIYTLDMLTGDVVRSADISDRSGMSYENALVASAAVFNPPLLVPGDIPHPAKEKGTRVYLPDIHGRVWRVNTDSTAPPLLFADAGAQQPFGNPVALLNYQGTGTAGKRPHVFAESGNENRIFPPPANTPPFRMYGLRDDDLAGDPGGPVNAVSGPAKEMFFLDFPNGFRGTVQPATAYNDTSDDADGRVFFAGTRFNPVSTPNAPPPPPCVSSFDSILFAVGAATGDASFDLNASGDDRSIQFNRQRIQAIRVTDGRLVTDTGLNAQNAPPPPAPPVVNPSVPDPIANIIMGPPQNPDGTSRIPGLVTYKVSSSVCR